MKNLEELQEKCSEYLESNFYVFKEEDCDLVIKKDMCQKYFIDVPIELCKTMSKIHGPDSNIVSTHQILVQDENEEEHIVEINKPMANVTINYYMSTDTLSAILIIIELVNDPKKPNNAFSVREVEIEVFKKI